MGLIGFDLNGMNEMQDKLKQLPDAAIGGGVELANQYILDFERLYPPRVEHGEDNPYHWDSEKQRRAFFATDGFGGGIPYQRTQNLAAGWKTVGYGKTQIVVNEVSYAKFVKDKEQSIGHMYDKWDILQTDLENRFTEIIRKFDAGVKNAIKKLGLA